MTILSDMATQLKVDCVNQLFNHLVVIDIPRWMGLITDYASPDELLIIKRLNDRYLDKIKTELLEKLTKWVQISRDGYQKSVDLLIKTNYDLTMDQAYMAEVLDESACLCEEEIWGYFDSMELKSPHVESFNIVLTLTTNVIRDLLRTTQV